MTDCELSVKDKGTIEWSVYLEGKPAARTPSLWMAPKQKVDHSAPLFAVPSGASAIPSAFNHTKMPPWPFPPCGRHPAPRGPISFVR